MRVDAHLDTVLQLRHQSTLIELPQCYADYTRLAANLDIAFWAFFIHPQQYRECPLAELLALWGKWEEDLKQHPTLVRKLLFKEQLSEEGCFLLAGTEGGAWLGNDLSLLPLLHRLGMRFISLTWNDDNLLAGAAGSPYGLTELGRRLVADCNQLGVVVDAAHASRPSFWQILETSRQPIMVSHAACDALCAHKRNLDDGQLRALGERGGVVGITPVGDFIGGNGDLAAMVNHIKHAVNIAGYEAVGIGSDGDGAELVGWQRVEQLPHLWWALAAAGFSAKQIEKISGGNFYRLLQEVLPAEAKCLI